MEMIQNILITVLLCVWVCLSAGFFVWILQDVIIDRKREKREEARAARDLEYHERRMNERK